MDNTKKRHADPKLLGKLNDPTDPGTILGAAVDSFVRQTQTPAEAQFATLIFQCRNLPNMAKQELEAFLREWCRKHSIASQIGAHNQQQGQQQQGQQQQGQQQQGQQQQGQQQQGQQQQGQQQQGQQQQGQQQQGQQQQGQQQRQERQQVYQGLQHEGHQRGDTATGPHDAFRTAGRCNPANSRPLWSGSLSLSWSLYPKIPSVGLMVTCSVERQQWSSREAAASWRWMNRLWAHEVAVPRSGQGNAATVSDDSDPVPGGVDPWQSGSGIEACEAGGIGVGAVEKDASSGESGGSARKEERDSTPGCGIISGVNAGDNHGGGREHVREDGDAASIGCAQSDGDTARGGNDGHGVTLDSDTTMQRSPLNFEDAIAFNLAYEKENNTPPYNRLPVLPLRLGSGLAASALPCGPLTHSSAGWQLLGAVSTAAMNHGWRPGPGDGKVHLRPLKRQRMDNDGGNTLGQNFAFVLDRCWNCGSYGHHLQGCIHPRNHAVVEACRRESSQLAQRTVRQAAAAQQRGPRKASYRRYFSMATAEEEREATAASCAGLGAVPACYSNCGELKRAPRDIRPGSLSTTLALALNLSCPSDPPPWLIGMAVHGIPPAYCRGPYIPDTTPPLALALGPPSAEPSDTAAWEGTCSEALCGVPVTAATIAAAAESCGQDGNDGCGAVIAQAIELLDGNPGRAAGDSAEGLPPKAMDLECPKGSTYPDTRHISVLEKWVVKQADITAAGKGSSGARMGCCKGDDGNGPVVVLGSIAALPGSFPDSEGLEGTSSSRAFAVEQQARSGLGTAAVAVAGTVAVESAPGFRGGEGACEESGPAMEEAALKGRCRDCSDSLASGTEVLILPDGMEPATLLHAAVGVEEMDPELDVDMDVDTDVHTVSLDIAAARAVAAGSTGSEADADADAEMALLLQPLLPDAPRHVLFAGLNTSIGQGACREHWQRALMSARQVMACVAAVGGCRRRHEGPQLSTWAAKVTGSGQGPSGAAVDAAPEQVEAVKVAAQAKAMDVPQTEEQPQPQTQQGWQRESFPQVRQSQPQWQSSMLTQEGFQQPAWFHQQKQQLAENHFRMQQHIMMLQQQQQQQHIWPATAFPMFFGGPTFQGLC